MLYAWQEHRNKGQRGRHFYCQSTESSGLVTIFRDFLIHNSGGGGRQAPIQATAGVWFTPGQKFNLKIKKGSLTIGFESSDWPILQTKNGGQGLDM